MSAHLLLGKRRPIRLAGMALLATTLALGTGLPAVAAPGEDLRFDFQCAGNVTATGYTAVPPASAYSADQGFGFLTPLASTACRDRGGAGDSALRDFVLATAGSTFRADVPDGTYTVVVRSGDLIASSNTGFTVGGQTAPNRSVASGVIDERVLDGVQASGGHLDFVFSGSSIRVNSIQVLPPVAAPEAVTAAVQATADAASVGLTWEAVEGASGYRVYRSTGGGEAVVVADVGAAAEPSWTDTSVQLADSYTYQVVGLGPAGREGERSEPLTVTVVDQDAAAPAVPSGLQATSGGNGVYLTWTAVDGATAYDVYRSRPGREPVRVARASGTAWTDTSAQATVDYVYRIVAVAPGGRSGLSDPVTVKATSQLKRQAERLDRSPVAVRTAQGVYVGWRLLGDDPQELAFHVYRDGKRITANPLTGSTNLVDAGGAAGATYRVSSVVNGIERWATKEFGVWQELVKLSV